MKSIPLQYAVYWLSKDGFLQCEMALYASIRGVLEKRWFMAELGFSLTTLLEAVF